MTMVIGTVAAQPAAAPLSTPFALFIRPSLF